MTFMEQVVHGNATLDQINSWIEQWENEDWSAGKQLDEYLGMTHEEYMAWVDQDKSLEQLVRERGRVS